MFRRPGFAIPLSAFCGASWMLPMPWVGPLLSLAFVGLVLAQKKALRRYLVALAYYGAGSVGLLRGVAVFFGPHAPFWEGAFLWLESSALLAAGWSLADRPWRAIAVLLFDALVPPLSFFDWLSPLASAGVLFPGFGWVGLILTLVWAIGVWYLLWPLEDRDQAWTAALLFGAVMIANAWPMLYPAQPPAGWRGVDLHVGPATTNILANQERHAAILRETMARSRNAKVLLLPETLETDWAGNAWAIQQVVPRGQTWLVGMSVPRRPGLLTDSIIALQHNKPQKILFNSAFPVPVSMWHPWSRGTGYVDSQNVGYEASWWEPARKIDGIRAWASICYDQLLPWVWMEALIQHPQVILLTNNEWWAQGTGIPTVQRNTAWAWGRLLGVTGIEAENT
ncbi:conjugal transfer protein TraB [Acidithiobacillus sp. YTS05]|uniref:conjugal transfer protein TraB n=1 Tax=Acidithiobacillus caldus TaxID=33059 RepID=UPI001D007F5D|nr:conjugal transfer protein TraB [Acidithiobacillus caldus]UTV80871.1 conjugal transfer protein TraB [Acidithiobacillus sp. YTS05]